MQLGLQPSQAAVKQGTIDDSNQKHKNIVNAAPKHEVAIAIDATTPSGIGRQDIMTFPTTWQCYKPAETNMCVTYIPHFKECIIMSLVCDHCGFKSNEIKGGGAIPKYGSKFVLKVNNQDDLEREILKSDTAGIKIPEVEFQLEGGRGSDGVCTTAEGLLKK